MTRLELLTLVIGRARSNGFEFRRWYTSRLGVPWISAEASLALLDQQRRYYALLFSHEFALSFWQPGSDITFSVPPQTFQRILPNGEIASVSRKGFVRRSARKDAWKYHLRQMALADEPLRYLRRYLHVEDKIVEDDANFPEEKKSGSRAAKKSTPPAKRVSTNPSKKSPGHTKPLPRPLPTGLPAFLQRPFNPKRSSES